MMTRLPIGVDGGLPIDTITRGCPMVPDEGEYAHRHVHCTNRTSTESCQAANERANVHGRETVVVAVSARCAVALTRP